MLPDQRYIYVADRAHFPYGGRAAEEIVAAISAVTERVREREDPKLIVVACNTASAVALPALRARFPLPFVGVVPAVKPAAALSKNRRVGVLATQRTVDGEYLRDLVAEHAAGCAVVGLPAGELVDFVEREMASASPEDRSAHVRREVDRIRRERVDVIVLGCTHFLHLEEEFRRVLDSEGIALVDSREGVARQVARLVKRSADVPLSESPDPDRRRDSLYVTGQASVEERYLYFASRFGLRLEGTL
jgi:glutamate racemase